MQYIQFQPQTNVNIPSASVGTINLFVDSVTNALTVKDENGAELSTATTASYSLFAENANSVTSASYSSFADNSTLASTASYLLGYVSPFPFTGSAEITGSLIVDGFVVLTQVSASLDFIDDAAAAAGGVPLGGLYRNGNFIVIRLA